MFAGTGGLSVTLRVHIDDRDADHSVDHDGGIVPDGNPRNRPFHQLFYGEFTYVRRVAELQKLASFPRRYDTRNIYISHNSYRAILSVTMCFFYILIISVHLCIFIFYPSLFLLFYLIQILISTDRNRY